MVVSMKLNEFINQAKDVEKREKGNGDKKLFVEIDGIKYGVYGLWVEDKLIEIQVG